MSAREDCRQFARECLRVAAEAKDDRQRQIFLEMADAWTAIAFENPLAVERAGWSSLSLHRGNIVRFPT
jgi:hypothetical protein